MKHQDYISLIKSVDLAIFDFKKQAAFGNIILLLYLGKKIYLNYNGIMYNGLTKDGLIVFDAKEIKSGKFLDDNKAAELTPNICYGKNLLSIDYICNQWLTALNDIKNKN